MNKLQAAGIVFIKGDKCLLLKRSQTSDHAGEWALVGGGIEEGETPEQAAIRECYEETGHEYNGELTPILRTHSENVDYTTFLAILPKTFPVKLNDEHSAYQWFQIDRLPNNTHPKVRELLEHDNFRNLIGFDDTRADAVVTELSIAQKIRDNILPSPQNYGNVKLFALRISGTGLSYRPTLNEFVERNPDNYLTDEFLARCNGLPVIWVHPESAKLDSASFSEQIVGTVFLPYILGDEVWGIAKIFDDGAAQLMRDNQLSTSPAVVFVAGTNTKYQLSDGSSALIEGKPSLVDHLAIVEHGVWDKGGKPSGVLNSHADSASESRADSADSSCSITKGGSKMANENVAPENQDDDGELMQVLKGIASGQQALISRIEALESKAPQVEAKPDAVAMPAPVLNAAPEATPAPEAKEPPSYVADMADMKSRLDAAAAEIAALKNPPRADESEAKAYAEAQRLADVAEQARGDSARRPMQGESVMAYRKALLAKHQPHSAKWAGKDVAAIQDPATLAVIEGEIYADSISASKSAAGMAKGHYRAVKESSGGREITRFIGNDSFTGEHCPNPTQFRIKTAAEMRH